MRRSLDVRFEITENRREVIDRITIRGGDRTERWILSGHGLILPRRRSWIIPS